MQREKAMVSVETALSVGPLIIVVLSAMLPLVGWLYHIEAGHSAREIAREYAIHGPRSASGLIEKVRSSGGDVRIEHVGEYAQITVVKKMPDFLDWIGIDIAGTHLVVMEPRR
ncbi:hypothetical protein [Arcanobacterium pinnipediorum]|uniref:TadE-like protein n=1 Tax=Arcanobacterium pinnipediorum TaxID=1503041 RepID=A0ABY5AH23_9ACTO|nr:hypothetical protein [Arcanobacterium pinnipediorum]USR79311.1 hypothetical protein NG665_08040 [Arcanobacterium pinnipediorum]